MSANFRSSYNELLVSGIKYTHSGSPMQMRYRESEEHPSLEQIHRMQEQRELKHHVLQIKLHEMQEQRPPTPPAFRQLPASEIEQISRRLKDSQTTASSGQLDEVSARRIDRASHKDNAKRYGHTKSDDFNAEDLVERVTQPTVATKLKIDAVKFQFGERHTEDERQSPRVENKKSTTEKNDSKDNKRDQEDKRELRRVESRESMESFASNKTA